MFGHYGDHDFTEINASLFKIDEAYDGVYELPRCFYLAPIISDGDKYTTKWVSYFDESYYENHRKLFRFDVDLSKVLIINSIDEYLHYIDIYGITNENNNGDYAYNSYKIKIMIDENLNKQKEKYDLIMSIISFFKDKYDIDFDIKMNKQEINKLFRLKFNVNTNDMKPTRYISCKLDITREITIEYLQQLRLLLIFTINKYNESNYPSESDYKMYYDKVEYLESKFKDIKRLDSVKIKEAGFYGYYLTDNIFNDIKKKVDIVYEIIELFQQKLLNLQTLSEITTTDIDDYCNQLTLYVRLSLIDYCKFAQLVIWNNDISFIKQIY